MTDARPTDVFSRLITSSILRGSRRKSNSSINNEDIVRTIQVDPVAELDSKLSNGLLHKDPILGQTTAELWFAQLVTNVQDQVWIPALTVRAFTRFLTEKKANPDEDKMSYTSSSAYHDLSTSILLLENLETLAKFIRMRDPSWTAAFRLLCLGHWNIKNLHIPRLIS